MRPIFKNAAVFAATVAMLGAVGSVPAAQATVNTIPLSPVSTMSAFNCPSGGLGNINPTTLEFTPASAAEPCEFSNGYNSIAYSPIDARIYSINLAGSGVTTLVANDVQGRNLEAWPANANKKRQLISGTTAGVSGYPSAIAINPANGAAIVIDAGGRIYQLDLSTGVASNPVQSNPNVGGLSYLAFSPEGTLYGFSSGRGNLYTIDTATGASTTVLTDWRTGIPNNAGNMKSISFDANNNMYLSGSTSISGDEGNGIYSTTPGNILGNVAQFFATPQAPTNGNPWIGNQSTRAGVGAIMVTYGNLAVNFDSTGGGAIESSRFYSKTINDSVTPHIVNPTITLPTPVRSGFTFNGWFTAASGGTLIGAAGASYTPYSDVSINMYAQWTEDALAATGFDAAPYVVTSSVLVALGVAGIYFSRRRKNSN